MVIKLHILLGEPNPTNKEICAQMFSKEELSDGLSELILVGQSKAAPVQQRFVQVP